MKDTIFIFFLCLWLLIVSSCGEGIAPIGSDNLPKIDTFDCPRPKFRPDGLPASIPSKSHKLQRISPDGTKIAYVVNENIVKIITLKTGAVETYNPKIMMDSNVYFNGCFDLRWCPYDDNKLCFMFVTAIDTTGHAVFGVYGQNLFILYRKENRFKKIDLPLMSKTGPEGLHIFGWMTGSIISSDSLLLGYGTEKILVTGIVVLPANNIITIPEFENAREKGSLTDFLYSPNRQHSAALIEGMRIPPYFNNIFIDGIPIRIEGDTIDLLSRLSWSPDGKKLAVTLSARGKWESIWVIDVEKWLRERPTYAPVEKIDFQKRFCMYNFGGGPIDAEFITNTTLAVSCHHDGDMLCPLWEITTDGRLLRQITHDD